ncbi:MAG: CHAT domain-containing protein [Planctomycetes bacterium]|nr:CHAT domain-containing protein [Planctomycetota bacterium]
MPAAIRIAIVFAAFVPAARRGAALESFDIPNELTALSQSAFGVEDGRRDAERCRAVWSDLEKRPAAERISGENALASVLAMPMASDTPEGQRTDDAKALDRLLAAESYYAALRRHVEDHNDLSRVVDRLRAVALHRRAGRMPRDKRGATLDAAIALHAENAACWKRTERGAWEACELSDLAYSLFVAERHDEAIPVREQAIALYRSLPDRFLTTDPFTPEGMNDEQSLRFAEFARDGYRGEAATYLLHGLHYFNLGREDPEAARESLFLYAESLRIGMAHRDPTPISNVGALLAPALGQETGRAKSISDLRRSLEALNSIDANPYWRDRGELESVDQAFRWLHARMREPIGLFYAETGQLLVARHILDEAESYAQDLDDAAILPMVLHAQAQLLARGGLAADSLAKARRILDSDHGRRQRIQTLALMARITFDQGEMERAVDYLRWATDNLHSRDRANPGSFTIHQDDIPLWGAVKAVESDLALAEGRVHTAIRLLGQAATITALTDEDDSVRLDARRAWLASRGTEAAYRPSPRLLAALRDTTVTPTQDLALRRGPRVTVAVPGWQAPAAPRLASRPSAPDGLSEAQVRWLRPRLLNRNDDEPDGEPVDPAKLTSRIEALGGTLFDSDRLKGQAAFLAGDMERAAGHYETALATDWRIAANALDPLLGVESIERSRQLHHEAALVAARRGDPMRALRILDMVRHRGLLDVATSGRSVWEGLTHEQRAEASRLDRDRTLAAQEVAELSRSGRLSNRLADAQKRLVAADGAYATFRSRMRDVHRVPPPPREPLGEDEVASLISDGEAVLVYSVGELETLAVLARRDADRLHCAAREISVSQSDLEAMVRSLQMGSSAPGEPFALLARELDRILFEPFADELAPCRLLVIGPDGPLHELAFAVLLDERDRCALDRWALAILPSLASQHRYRSAEAPNPGGGALLIDLQEFGDRVWLPSSYAGQLNAEQLTALLPQYQLARLTHTRREADRLAELFGDRARRMNGVDAQEEDVLAAALVRRFVHFATHGLVDVYNPFQSVLVLGAPSPGSDEDGFLEAGEILDTGSLGSAELVTLSACESGLGLLQGSEGVLGLTWALLGAGNRAVVSSLWSVEDEATADFMVELYRELLDGQTKAESLRRAALALRQRPETGHPAYWGGFQLVGDWR